MRDTSVVKFYYIFDQALKFDSANSRWESRLQLLGLEVGHLREHLPARAPATNVMTFQAWAHYIS